MVSVPCVGLAIADIQQVSLKWFVTLHHDQSTASFSHQTFGEKYNNSSHQKVEGIAQMVKLVACQVKSPDFHNVKTNTHNTLSEDLPGFQHVCTKTSKAI